MGLSECPECTYHIPIQKNMKKGDIIICPDCSARLKIISLDPLIFESLEQE